MHLLKNLFRHVIAGYCTLLLISMMLSVLSVYGFARLAGIYYPIRSINSNYYDHSYYVTSLHRFFQPDYFIRTINKLEALPFYDGADYIIYYVLDNADLNKIRVPVALCGRHMEQLLCLDVPEEDEKANNGVIAPATCLYHQYHVGDLLLFHLPSGKEATIRIEQHYNVWDPLPLYPARYDIGRAQSIYTTRDETPLLMVSDRYDWYKEWNTEQNSHFFFPASMTIFFKRDLTAQEEKTVTDLFRANAVISPIDDVRLASDEEASRLSKQTLPFLLIAFIIMFFSFLSISLLASYQTKPVYRVYLLCGMSNRRLKINLILPGVFNLAVSSVVYVLYSLLLTKGYLGRNFLQQGAMYNPKYVLYYIIIYGIMLMIVYLLLSGVLSIDERRFSIYDHA